MKPSCVRLQNSWVSDRTLCYLASGKPAVVEHTGPSRFLPDSGGLFRFRDVEEAVLCLEKVANDYKRQCTPGPRPGRRVLRRAEGGRACPGGALP